MATQNQKQQFEKMTYFAAVASAWARLQFLRHRKGERESYNTFSEEEIVEHQFLEKWWRGLASGDKLNIERICKDMARDVPAKHMSLIQTTKNEHNDKVVKAGGYL